MSTATVHEARRTRATRAEMEERAEALITLASANGPCSVRHLFYAATVAKVPGIMKNQAGYDKVQRQVLALRRDGRIPYRPVVDGTRWMRKPASYTSAAAALEATAALYRRNLWATSRWRVEVWAESDSIAGTIFDITARWDVPLMVTRGQSSETFAHNAAEAWKETSSVPSVLYIGDHDPAGLDIEESVRTKLETFYGRTLLWDRVGVTWSQAEALDLPGTPPKTAGRRKPYPFPLAVEAEALPAPLLRELLDDAIAWHVDQDELDVLLAAEESEREILHRMAGAVS